MTAVAIILARYRSSCVPNESLALTDKKKIIKQLYPRCVKAKGIKEVYVATDDAQIAEGVEGFGGKAILTPMSLTSGINQVAHAANATALPDNCILVSIPGNQPFVNSQSIEQIIAFFKADASEDFAAATLSYRINDLKEINNSNTYKVVSDKNGYAMYFSRSVIPYNRDKKTNSTYFKQLGIHASRKWFALSLANRAPKTLELSEKSEQLRILEYGGKIKVIESLYDSPEISIPEDITRHCFNRSPALL